MIHRRLLVAWGLGLACNEPPAPTPAPVAPSVSTEGSAQPTGEASARGSLAGAREVLERFTAPDADQAALLRTLAPRPGDAGHVFGADFAARAEPHYRARFTQLTLAPTDAETELLLWKVRSEELRDGTGDAEKCPGEYRKVGTALAPGVTWYCFRFVKPAEKKGTALEGLVFVAGHWALFPAPWQVE